MRNSFEVGRCVYRLHCLLYDLLQQKSIPFLNFFFEIFSRCSEVGGGEGAARSDRGQRTNSETQISIIAV